MPLVSLLCKATLLNVQYNMYIVRYRTTDPPISKKLREYLKRGPTRGRIVKGGN